MVPSVVSGFLAVLNIVFFFVQVLVFGSVIISWVNADPSNPIVRFIEQATEPMYRPIRRFTSRLPGPFDWAPFVLLLVVIFLQRTVQSYAMRMGIAF